MARQIANGVYACQNCTACIRTSNAVLHVLCRAVWGRVGFHHGGVACEGDMVRD
jgi:hypothetical protein